MAALWAHEYLSRESLPTSIGALRMLRPWPDGQPVRCEAFRQSGSKLVNEWTLRFKDEVGSLLTVIEGLKMHVLPSREAASESGNSGDRPIWPAL